MAGISLAVLGLVVLVVAVVALHDPKGHVQNAAASSSTSTTASSSASANRSPSPGPSTRTSASTAAGSTSASTRVSTSTRASTSASTSRPATGVRAVPLVVLNNTTTGGLAQTAAIRFRAGGWKVSRFSNYSNSIVSTCAYYDPSSPGAQAAATALQKQFPTIKRVLPRFAQLPSGPVVVVLTPDYSSN